MKKIKAANHIKLYLKLIFLILFFFISNSYAQYRFKTSNRDTTKYSEKNIDVKIFRTFNNIHSKFVNSLINITNESIVPVSIGTPTGLYIVSRINDNHYDESSAILLILSEITNEAFTQALKYTIKRNRPFRTLNNVYLNDTNSVRGSYSFPSGHSSGSFVIATSLTLRYHDKPLLIAGLFTYATIVSLGRIYWGVHYPSDVLTGMLVGAGSAALIYSLRKPIIKAKNKLFNQEERNDSYQTNINPGAILLSFAITDFINFHFKKSDNEVLKRSHLNFSSSGKNNYLNYNYNF